MKINTNKRLWGTAKLMPKREVYGIKCLYWK